MSVQIAGVVPQLTMGWRLKMALGQVDMTVQQMAAELGVSRQTATSYVTDRATPKRAYLVMWALRTGVPLSWLETGIAPVETDGDDGSYTTRALNPEPSD